MHLRECLQRLLSNTSPLKIEDLLPLFPAKTKMRDIKKFLATRITDKITELNKQKLHIVDQSQQIATLLDSQRNKSQEHIMVDPEQVCSICEQSIFQDEFYIFPCTHCLHRQCLLTMIQNYEATDAFKRMSKPSVKTFVTSVLNMYDKVEEFKIG